MSLVAVHELLTHKTAPEWSSYWNYSDTNEPNIYSHYPHYIAALVKKINKSKGARVFIIHKDRAFFLAGFLAALHAGLPVILPQSDAPGLLQDLFQPGDVLLTNQPELSQLFDNAILMDEVSFVPNNHEQFSPLDPTTSFVTFYTSGSTGQPKPVEKSLTQLEAEIATLQQNWGGYEDRATFLSTVPHHHIYGLLFSLLWPVCGGYRLASQTFTYWEELLQQCAPGDYIVSSPSHLGRFPIISDDMTNRSPRFVFSSGGVLPFSAVQMTKKYLGVLPTEVYGSTETGGIAYRQQQAKDQAWTKFSGIELSEGENQKLCVQSSYLPSGIVYQTEDRVCLVTPNNFHLLGRADRIIKIEGKRVCLLELELKLKELELIDAAAVLPLDNEQRDELGSIVILSTQGQKLLSSHGKAQLIGAIRKHMIAYFDPVTIPRKWRFLSKMPVNEQGKSPYHLLKQYFVQDFVLENRLQPQQGELKWG